jgi:hypothetical protein
MKQRMENQNTYVEVKKVNGFRSQTDKKTKLTIVAFNNTKKQNFPFYYVNGVEFMGNEKFAINFLDLVTDDEEDHVLIPEHTETSFSVGVPG